ncbi:gliding motility-associated-like protein [Flavobacterium arsenatis]|uniref:Gliding motility-associated-like protein n=1 Tax=Flavobacterium arsenatis TaxID=1484332 RepID=A0ABU1TLU0_9FLAO|nr:T9SS type B sorting domain-containing protein [Flavobacterium arsenatis]MDR6966905.1 gliding motility-associated-like protein [Flavobacterium arsenatis]
MKVLHKILILIFLLMNQLGYAQEGASSCSELQANFQQYQSCATSIPFQNTTNNGNGETFVTSCIGEDFKAPTWFFMKILNSGNIFLQISQVSTGGFGTDVDFVLWGPFNNLSNICSQLNLAKEVDCSYAPDSIENVQLFNAVAGEFYILLVDNWSNIPGEITITQTGGSGSSDCSFLSSVEILDTAGNEITQLDYCKPATKDLVATIDVNDFPGNLADLRFNYKWYRNDVLLTEILDSTSNTNTFTVDQTGLYKVETTAYDFTDPDVDPGNLVISADEIQLNFYDKPILNAGPHTLQQCDFIPPNNDGVASVNLTELAPEITNNDNLIALSYFTDAALTQQITNPADFTNTIAFNQTIYVTGRYGAGPVVCNSDPVQIQLTVNPTSVSNYPDMAPACPELNTNSTTFDFDSQRILIKNTFFPTTNVGIAFYRNTTDASIEQNELTNASTFVSGIYTIYTRIETGNDCAAVGIFEIEVYEAPNQNPITPILVCEDETVILASKDAEILALQNPTVQTRYFFTFENARDNINAINKNSNLNPNVGSSTIFVRLTDNANQCFSVVNFAVNVFPLPNITTPSTLSTCGDNTSTLFNLNSKIAEITGNNSNYTVAFYATQADLLADDAIPNPETYNSVSKTIFVKATDPTGNNCTAETTLALNVLQVPGIDTVPQLLEECDATGFHVFDITEREPILRGTTPMNETVFRYYINLSDAEANNNNTINTPQTFTNTVIDYQKVYIRLNSTVNFDSQTGIPCHRIYEQELFVRPYPENLLKDTSYKICIDIDGNVVNQALVDAGLPDSQYSFDWFNEFDALAENRIINGNERIFTTPFAGEYSVKITNITNSALCSTIVNFTVENTLIPFSIKGEPTELIGFGIDNTITAITTPQSADFEYMLNNEGWQQSNVFNTVSDGIHLLSVRNKFGCGEISTSVVITDYPKYFTPNGDGYHDYWNIGGRVGVDALNVYIFDRSGKLIKDLTNNESGWDGTYEGRPLPSDDYWFKVIYSKNGVTGEYMNHFSLKR